MDTSDTEAMADFIVNLSENGVSAGIRKNARERIQRDYDISASAAQYERLFRSC
jgi:glycosyltransferase involved in cell wall biosynthesis